jgi:hypothetical protein
LRDMNKACVRCSCGREHALSSLRDVVTAAYTNKQRHILRQMSSDLV